MKKGRRWKEKPHFNCQQALLKERSSSILIVSFPKGLFLPLIEDCNNAIGEKGRLTPLLLVCRH